MEKRDKGQTRTTKGGLKGMAIETNVDLRRRRRRRRWSTISGACTGSN